MNIIINEKVIINNVTIEDIYATFEGLPETTCIPVILENGDDYVQALSSRKAGVIEARFYEGDSFRHFRGKNITEDRSLAVLNGHTDSPITVQKKNILSTQTMRIVFTDFYRYKELSSCLIWDDVTQEFDDEHLIDEFRT